MNKKIMSVIENYRQTCSDLINSSKNGFSF